MGDLKTENDCGRGHAGPFNDQRRTGGQHEDGKGVSKETSEMKNRKGVVLICS